MWCEYLKLTRIFHLNTERSNMLNRFSTNNIWNIYNTLTKKRVRVLPTVMLNEEQNRGLFNKNFGH